MPIAFDFPRERANILASDGNPWVMTFAALGEYDREGGWLTRLVMVGNYRATSDEGFFILSEGTVLPEVSEMTEWSWISYDLSLNRNPSDSPLWMPEHRGWFNPTVKEFEDVFGGWGENQPLKTHEITIANINRVIWGQ